MAIGRPSRGASIADMIREDLVDAPEQEAAEDDLRGGVSFREYHGPENPEDDNPEWQERRRHRKMLDQIYQGGKPDDDLERELDELAPVRRADGGPVNLLSLGVDRDFNTMLSPDEEREFQDWKKRYAPNDSGHDYDLRGAFKAHLEPAANGHWPDTFKKPNHPTFSDESRYAPFGTPGHWQDDVFIPPARYADGGAIRTPEGPSSLTDDISRELGVQPPAQPWRNPGGIGEKPGDRRRLSDDDHLQVLKDQVRDPQRDPRSDGELYREIDRVQGAISRRRGETVQPASVSRPSSSLVDQISTELGSQAGELPETRPAQEEEPQGVEAINRERALNQPARAIMTSRGGVKVLPPDLSLQEPPQRSAPWFGENGVFTNSPAAMVASSKNAAAGLQYMAAEEERQNRLEALSESSDVAGFRGSAQFRKLERESTERHKAALKAAETAGEQAKLWAAQTKRELQLVTPEDMTTLQNGVFSFIESAPPMAVGIAAGILTKNPELAMLIASGGGGAQQAGGTYLEAREAGASHRTSAMSAGIQGAIEMFDALPVGVALKEGSPFLKHLLVTMGTEGMTEAVQQGLQDLQAFAAYNPDMTLGEAWQNMKVAAVAGVLGGAVFGTAGHLANKGQEKPGTTYITEDQARSIREQVKAIMDASSVMQPLNRAPAAMAQMTHRLEDGTPVGPVVEDGKPVPGVWKDARGTIFESPRAEPVNQEPNATWTQGGVPYEVEVTGPGSRKGSARLADGQEVSVASLKLEDEAKARLGLVPREMEQKPAPAAPPQKKKSAISVRSDEFMGQSGAAPAMPAPQQAAAAKPAEQQPKGVAAPGKAVSSPPREAQPTTPAAAAAAPEPAAPPQEKKLIIEKAQPAAPAPKLEGTRSLLRQNRLREGVASIAQMNQIANAPDFDRLSFSKAPETGAPMVSIAGEEEAQSIPPEQQGRSGVVVIGGEKVPVRYAVVEAKKLLASHTAEGRVNDHYFEEPKAGQIRALNNGRAAGLREAYMRDTAGEYRKSLEAAFDEHGVDAHVIQRMERPVLVRIYPDSFNTKIANIGEKSQGETLQQSPLEIALQDSAKLHSLEGFQPSEDGDVSAPSNDDFVRRFIQTIVPENERGRLFDPTTKKPNKLAYDRIEAAIFQKAYGSKDLTGLFAEANEPEIRAVLSALAIAAPDMAQLDGTNAEVDIRPFVAEAAKLVLQAKRAGTKLETFIKQQDLEGRHPLVQELGEFMAAHIRSPRKMGEGFKAGAKFVQFVVQDEATADIFGDKPKFSVGDALKAINKFMEVEYGQAGSSAGSGGEAAPKAAQDAARYDAGRSPPDAAHEPRGGEPPSGHHEILSEGQPAARPVRREAGHKVEQLIPLYGHEPADKWIARLKKKYGFDWYFQAEKAVTEAERALGEAPVPKDNSIAEQERRNAWGRLTAYRNAAREEHRRETGTKLEQPLAAYHTEGSWTGEPVHGVITWSKGERGAFQMATGTVGGKPVVRITRGDNGTINLQIEGWKWGTGQKVRSLQASDMARAKVMAEQIIGKAPSRAAEPEGEYGSPDSKGPPVWQKEGERDWKLVSGRVDFTSHDHPVLAVPCPQCAAAVDVWCKRPSGHAGRGFTDLHAARKKLADSVHEAQGDPEIVNTSLGTKSPKAVGKGIWKYGEAMGSTAGTPEKAQPESQRAKDNATGPDEFSLTASPAGDQKVPEAGPEERHAATRDRNEAILTPPEGTAPPQQSELAAVLERYDDPPEGEAYTGRDLLAGVKALVDDERAPGSLLSAIYQFEDALQEDRELGGRGDVDSAEEDFVRAVRAAAAEKAVPTQQGGLFSSSEAPVERPALKPRKPGEGGPQGSLFQPKGVYGIDAAAREAKGHEASEPQQEAGNYPKGRHTFNAGTPLAVPVVIENEAGTSRRPEWPPLKDHYGDFPETIGFDKDKLDGFFKPGTPDSWTGPVYVVNQSRERGGARVFDEHKVMFGYSSLAEAREAYLRNYEPSWEGLESIVEMSLPAFREWAHDKGISGPRGGKLTLSEAKRREILTAASRAHPQPGQAAPQRDLLSRPTLPGETARILDEPVVVEAEKQGSVKLPKGRITTAEEAATAFRELADSPRERFYMIGTNERGVPIAFYKLFSGTLTQTSVYPREVWTVAYQTPGVKAVWFAHNHPSGIALPSQADELLTQNLRRWLEPQHGITYRDHIIIAGGDRAYSIEGRRSFDIPQPPAGSRSVPVVERVVKRQNVKNAVSLTSPGAVREYLKVLDPKEPGLILLDAQHRAQGWWPVTVKAGAHFLWPGERWGRIMRMIGRNNPAAAIFYAPEGSVTQDDLRAGVLELREVLSLADVKLLDGFSKTGGTLVSMAEGNLMQDVAPYTVDSAEHAYDVIRDKGPANGRIYDWRRFVQEYRKLEPTNPVWVKLEKWIQTRLDLNPRDLGMDRYSTDVMLRAAGRGAFQLRRGQILDLGPLQKDAVDLINRYERLEKAVDEAYEKGDTRAEDLDAELAVLRDQVTGMGEEMLEDESDHEGEVSLEHLLISDYMRLMNEPNPSGRAMIIERARQNIATAGYEVGKVVAPGALSASDAEVVEAMRDAYLSHAARRERIRGAYQIDQTRRGLHIDAVNHELKDNPIAKALGTKLHVVRSALDLPVHAVREAMQKGAMRIVRGYTDYTTGDVYVVAGNLEEGDAQVTLLHEAVGHVGINNVLPAEAGKEVEAAMLDIYASRQAQIKAAARSGALAPYNFDFSVRAHRIQATMEYVAHMAETGQELNLWQRVVAAIRSALRKIGFVKEWSEADILRLLQLSRNALTGSSQDSFNGLPSWQLGERGPVWYSALERAVERIEMSRASPQQWMGTIEGRPGVKPSEIEWSGLREWLATQDGLVEKESLLAYLRDNGVQLIDQIAGGESTNPILREWDQITVELDAEGFTVETSSDGAFVGVLHRGDGGEGTLYLTPAFEAKMGGADTLPPAADSAALRTLPIDKALHEDFTHGIKTRIRRLLAIEERYRAAQPERRLEGARHAHWTLPGGEDYRELLIRLPGDEKFKEGNHFDAPNIVAHIRFKTRFDADGKRVMFIEEIQSDWAERGRKYGFREAFWTDDQEKRFMELQRRVGAVGLRGLSESERVEVAALARERDASDIAESRNLPVRAPFVEKTPQWVALALKRAIRYAVDGGFDRVAWTTGDQQNSRYGLERHLKSLLVTRNKDNTFRLQGVEHAERGGILIGGHVPEAELEEKLGERLGKHVKEVMGGNDSAVFTNLTDKIGGEGMRAFYDQIVPNIANDVLKRLGGDKVIGVRIGGLQDPTNENLAIARLAGMEDVTVHHPDVGNMPDRNENYRVVGQRTGTEYYSGNNYDIAHRVATEVRLGTHPQPGFDITEPMRMSVPLGLPMFQIREFPRAGMADWSGARYERNGQFIQSYNELRRAYFEPGNIVPTYGGGRDRVLGYKESDTGVFPWAATVQEVALQNGEWVPHPAYGRIRHHSTEPTRKELHEVLIQHGWKPVKADVHSLTMERMKRRGGAFQLRERSGLSEVFGVRDGRLLGMARRAYGQGAWTVFIATGANETFFTRGQFRKIQAATIQEVQRIFSTEGLELRVTRPQNIPVPDVSILDGDWVAPRVDSWFKRAVIYFQNRLALPEQYERTIEQNVGAIPESAKAHREARLAHPRAAGKIADFEHDFVEPIIDMMKEHRLTVREVGRYLYARHAPERNAAIEEINPDNKSGSGMTDERAAEVIEQFRRDGKLDVLEKIGDLADRVSRFREDVMVDKGLAKRETVALLRMKYRHYVPLKEVVDDEYANSVVSNQTGAGFQVGRTLARAFGRFSEAEADFILPGLIAQAKGTIAAGENAEVLRAFLRQVEFAPNPEVWRIQRVVWKPYIDRDTGEVRYAPRPVQIDADYSARAISVPVNGDRHVVVVEDQNLADAFKKSGLPLSGALQTIGAITRFYAAMATAANPEFVFTNLMRDFQQAMVRITGEQDTALAAKVARDVLPAMWGAFRGLREHGQLTENAGEWHQWYRRFIEAGGHVAYRGIQDAESQHQDFLSKLAEAGIYPEQASTLEAAKMRLKRAASVSRAQALTQLVSDINGAVENALRLSTFRNAVESGWNEKDAAMLARNVTVDFNLKGEAGTFMNSLYMFFNANVQGNALLLRSIVNHPRVRVAALALLALGALLDWWNRQYADKDVSGRSYYDEISEDIKQRNWVIMGPDRRNAILIPLPFGFNIFHTMGRHLVAAMPRENGGAGETVTKAAISTFGAMFNAVSPFGNVPESWLGMAQLISPTVADPVVQRITNRNWLDKPIFPERPHGATPQASSETYYPGTPEYYVAASQWLNRSTGGNEVRSGLVDPYPNVLQHWVNTVFGSTGATYGRILGYVGGKAIAGREIETREIPFLRRFYYEPRDFELSHRFYDHVNEAEVAHYEVLRAMQGGRGDEAQMLRQEYTWERRQFGAAQDAERTVASIRTQIAAVRRHPTMSPEQKRATVEKLQEQSRQVMQRFNAEFEREQP